MNADHRCERDNWRNGRWERCHNSATHRYGHTWECADHDSLTASLACGKLGHDAERIVWMCVLVDGHDGPCAYEQRAGRLAR